MCKPCQTADSLSQASPGTKQAQPKEEEPCCHCHWLVPTAGVDRNWTFRCPSCRFALTSLAPHCLALVGQRKGRRPFFLWTEQALFLVAACLHSKTQQTSTPEAGQHSVVHMLTCESFSFVGGCFCARKCSSQQPTSQRPKLQKRGGRRQGVMPREPQQPSPARNAETRAKSVDQQVGSHRHMSN
jgi:hypothetical protein